MDTGDSGYHRGVTLLRWPRSLPPFAPRSDRFGLSRRTHIDSSLELGVFQESILTRTPCAESAVVATGQEKDVGIQAAHAGAVESRTADLHRSAVDSAAGDRRDCRHCDGDVFDASQE